MSLPEWMLPPGVSRGAWDYAQSREVATQYDAYHAGSPLMAFDAQVVRREFEPPGLVADLGCGSGRALLPLLRNGGRGLAVDLSQEMLDVVAAKAAAEGLPVQTLRANLVELHQLIEQGAVAAGSADYAMCLFSTLGMIRGRPHRRAALAGMRRLLRPGGKLVLHAHNLWWNLRDPGGPRWLASNAWRVLARREEGLELGDRYYPYRGVPNFFLHVYRWPELRADLRGAGFQVLRREPLSPGMEGPLRRPWWAPGLRASGWLVVCRAPPGGAG